MKIILKILILHLFFSQTSVLSEQPRGGICTKGNCENGKGTKQWDSGLKYIGQWKDGKYNGKGVLSNNIGGTDYIVYDGEWKNSNMDGAGIFFNYYVPAIKNNKISKDVRDKIIGNYKNGVAIGKVTAEYASKCKFVGEYKDRSIDAQGIYTCPNEYKFEGVWSVEYEKGKKGTLTCFIGKKKLKILYLLLILSYILMEIDGNIVRINSVFKNIKLLLSQFKSNRRLKNNRNLNLSN